MGNRLWKRDGIMNLRNNIKKKFERKKKKKLCRELPDPGTCKLIKEVSDVDKYYKNEEYYFMQVDPNLRIDHSSARKQAEGIEEGSPHLEVGDIVACRWEIPKDIETVEYIHVSPKDNKDSILKEGLIPSMAQDCKGDKGIYLTNSPSEGEEWGRVLAGERSIRKLSMFEVHVPKSSNCMPVVEDTRPIDKMAVPGSEIACTEIGIPPYLIEHIKDFRISEEEQRMGGIR